MRLGFSEDQEELRRFVRQFLEEKSPESAVRELMRTDAGYDDAVWRQMAEQLGLQGIAVEERYGGGGFTFRELALVLEEMGRALLCAPFFSAVVLAAGALSRSGDEAACEELLPAIAAGDCIATLAFEEDDDSNGVVAVADGTGWRLRGEKTYVLDGHVADVVLVVARTPKGLGLFRCSGDAEALQRELLPTLDLTRKQARLSFSGTPAVAVGRLGDGAATLDAVLQRAAVALAAEQVGGTQRCLDMAVGYARERMQFGRPIGSFQAIKHRCADLLLECETARSAAYYAAWCAASGDDDLPVAAAMAKAHCSDAYYRTAAENIQIHGGIGFTWEHPAHLYFKRAKASQLMFGDSAHHRARLADLVGL
ncbi:MAG: acyl-CoA/acyl-ACP dehydrogenase [bacterium]|nr:acyl-CoA/acyl-ACP dehydrogenase [bacterium]MXV91845.1 acyl-CoA dehydrogenase [Acidimicrobiia bacterium]MYC44304.1 acyl-CoA dehydrogenase [Acidimicrobiia bacterium]